MSAIIQLRTGTGSAVPISLTQGEVGINIDTGLFYFGSSSNEVRSLENFTNITASGGISAGGQIIGYRILCPNNYNIRKWSSRITFYNNNSKQQRTRQ